MALQSNTLANPRNAFYATATESGKLWYTFPSQTGQVLLNDASGTQVLRAIGGDLFFNDELLAKAGDIQDIADWALYPALGDVNMDGQNLLDVSSAVINNGLSAGVTTLESVTVTNGITSNANITTASLQMAGEPVPALGQITTKSMASSGAVVAGSISTAGTIGGGAISGTSITTTGGVDMTNSAITRASSIAISNSGFAPYGALTSPDGSLLTWNGQTITTGAGGNASQWANYPAIAPIQGNGQSLSNLSTLATTSTITSGGNVIAPNVVANGLLQAYDPSGNPALTVTAQNPAGLLINSLSGGIASVATAGNIESTSSAGDITTTAYNSISMDSGNDISLTANPGLNPLYTAAINLNAKNGNGGQVNIVADPGAVAAFGGVVNITANGGTILIPQPPPDPPLSVTVGGEVNITANTGGSGLYTLTSAVNIGAAGVNSYAGAIPPIGSVAGYNFIYGTNGVNICSGLPSAGFQLPFTTYLYGVGLPGSYGGVRMESPQGIQMLSDTYMQNLYPLDTDGLTIAGRSFLGTGSVYIEDVAAFTMNGGAALETDNISSVSNSGIIYTDNFIPSNNSKGVYANFVKPLQATAPGVPNLVISNNPFLANTNYVEIAGATTIAFDPTGTGALSGVQSINGAAWPPPTGDASLWSQYPATSIIDVSGFDISGVTTINGAVYPPAVSTADWSTYPAIQNVDISGFDLNNVNNLTMPDNGVIVSAGQLSIFADLGKNLNIASNGGGDVNIGTGNAADINITTGGTGNELNLGGDVVNLDATLGVRVAAPSLDLVGNNIVNVASLNGTSATNMTISTSGAGTLTLQSDTGSTIISSTDAVNVNGGTGVDITATTNGVQLNAGVGLITLNAPTTRMLGAATVGGTLSATGDVVSSSAGSTPYSLNEIGAAVNGVQQYDYWVAVNGSNTTGTGSVLRPFATVTAALAATVSISDTIPVNINITAGTYTENPNVTRNNTFLVGNVGVADAIIIGTVTFNPTATATVSQGMSGITVVGNVSCLDVSPFDLNWYFQYCNITSYGTTALTATSDLSGNNSLIMNNTVVTQNVTANTCIALTSVRLNAIQCQLNNTTTGSCVSSNGTGSMSLFGCTLTAAGTATASPLITFISAIANGVASSFQLCTFTYTASTVGSGKTAVFFNNGGALAGLTLFNQNVFNMLGSSSLILRPGAGSVAIQWGTNSSNILTIPAAGAGLTYTYLTSTPLRANVLYDSASSAGTANQVLGAGAGGGTLTWRSLTNTSLGAIPAATNATVYQNQPLFYNTATQSINYIAAGDDVIVQPCPASANPVASQRGITYIATSAAGGSTFQFANGGGLTANDVGWYIYIKNGNPNAGGDITLTGALVSGNTVIHNGTALQNGGITILTWNGTAFVAY